MSRVAVISEWVIDQRKLSDYLLNPHHPQGASKAKYLMAFGYGTGSAHDLSLDLAKHAVTNGPGREVVPPVGLPRLIIEGPFEAPDGRRPSVRTVWEQTGANEARFITLVPLTR